MNRIYQGKVTAVEIHVPPNKENPWQPFDPDSKQANRVAQATRLVKEAGQSVKGRSRELCA